MLHQPKYVLPTLVDERFEDYPSAHQVDVGVARIHEERLMSQQRLPNVLQGVHCQAGVCPDHLESQPFDDLLLA